MTDKMIWACMVMMAIAVVSILFIRRAILYRRRIRENIRSYIRSDIPTQGRGNTVYEERFLFTPRAPFSSPKSVRIRPEYYDLLCQITQISGCSNISLTAYLDNVLRAHFEDYRDSIRKWKEKASKEIR